MNLLGNGNLYTVFVILHIPLVLFKVKI